MCGVSAQSVTEACRSKLAPAVFGSRIDAAHPAAVAYRKKKEERPTETSAPAPGIDPLYEKALEIVWRDNRFSATHLRKTLKIDNERAKRIIMQLIAAQVIPVEGNIGGMVVKPRPISPPAKKSFRREKYTLPENIDPPDVDAPEDVSSIMGMTLREIITVYGTGQAFGDWLDATETIEKIHEKRLKNAQTEGKLVSRDLVKRGIIEPIETAHVRMMTDGAKTIARRTVAMVKAGRGQEPVEAFIRDQISSFIRPVKSKVKRAMAAITKVAPDAQ